MSIANAVATPPLGISIPDDIIRVTCRGGAGTAGQVKQFDISGSDAAVLLNGQLGGTDSVNVNVVTPIGAVANYAMYCMLLEAIADDGSGYALIRGVVNVNKIWSIGQGITGVNLQAEKDTDTITAGAALVALDGAPLATADTTTGYKIFAISQSESAVAAGGAGVAVDMPYALFNGIEGFGFVV